MLNDKLGKIFYFESGNILVFIDIKISNKSLLYKTGNWIDKTQKYLNL